MKHPIKTAIIVFLLSVSLNLYSNSSHSVEGFSEKELDVKLSKSKKDKSKPDSKTKLSNNDFLNNIIDRVKSDYVEEKSNDDIAKAAANGILTSLDPHSSYLSSDDFNEMRIQTKGQFGGVGIEITMENSLIKVVSPIEDTPAFKAGIKSGDYITKIDGKTAVDITIDEAVKRLRGKPRTKVNITIVRKEEKNPIEFYIRRQIIKIKSVRSNKFEDVAYVKVNSFSGQSYEEVKNSLKNLIEEIERSKIKGIILDLRNNPGGLLDQSIKISELFLDKNQKIVSIKGRNKDSNKEYKDEKNQVLTKGIPVVILINEGSASASEIVAGALQDNKRALVLGKKSFGKGSVQTIIPLKKNQGAIKMTTSLYYTPSGKSIQAKGIEPDVIISEAKIKKSEEKDYVRSESNLSGHIKNNTKNSKKSQIDEKNIELYNEDYQLARAIDLVRGISFYKKINDL